MCTSSLCTLCTLITTGLAFKLALSFFPVHRTPMFSFCTSLNTLRCVHAVFVHYVHQAWVPSWLYIFFLVHRTPIFIFSRSFNTVHCVQPPSVHCVLQWAGVSIRLYLFSLYTVHQCVVFADLSTLYAVYR